MCIFWSKKKALPFEVDKKLEQMRTVLNKLSLAEQWKKKRKKRRRKKKD